MKIAYCIHSLVLRGGMERVLTIKANYLVKKTGHEVWIITAHQKGRAPVFPLDPRVHFEDIGRSERFLLGPYRRGLDRILCRVRPDITISMGGRDMLCLHACTDGSRKMAEFHFPHGKYILKHGDNPLSRLRTRNMERAAAGLDAFVVLTEADRKEWEKTVPRVTNICNPLTFTCVESASLEAKRAVAIGRLDANKNFADLISAWKTVSAKHPDWTLDIFGSGKEESRLRAQVERLGLSGKVRLAGRTSSVKEELLGSSLMALSSLFEGLPMVLLEAMACGVPVVSYDCPKGPREIVEDGKTGFLVPLRDVDALSGMICRLIEDKPLRLGMGACAKKASEKYRIEDTMQKWEELWTRLLHT